VTGDAREREEEAAPENVGAMYETFDAAAHRRWLESLAQER
jgi:hypothetical protein